MEMYEDDGEIEEFFRKVLRQLRLSEIRIRTQRWMYGF
jgi:hypothetical protein